MPIPNMRLDHEHPTLGDENGIIWRTGFRPKWSNAYKVECAVCRLQASSVVINDVVIFEPDAPNKAREAVH